MKKLLIALLVLAFACVAMADTTTGLVGWWKMDGPTDPENARIVKDYSGYGNDGTMGSADTWLAEGGIDFDGGSWGASGITFANNGADLIADMGLTDQVTVSFVMSGYDGPAGGGYAFDGRNSSNGQILSAECPTGCAYGFLTKVGDGGNEWMWESLNPEDGRYIFAETDERRITLTANFATGEVKYYLDGQLWSNQTGKTGSFTDLTTFTIGRTLWAEYYSDMEDFRIYNRELSASDVAELVPEPTTIALLGFGGLALIRRKK